MSEDRGSRGHCITRLMMLPVLIPYVLLKKFWVGRKVR